MNRISFYTTTIAMIGIPIVICPLVTKLPGTNSTAVISFVTWFLSMVVSAVVVAIFVIKSLRKPTVFSPILYALWVILPAFIGTLIAGLVWRQLFPV